MHYFPIEYNRLSAQIIGGVMLMLAFLTLRLDFQGRVDKTKLFRWGVMLFLSVQFFIAALSVQVALFIVGYLLAESSIIALSLMVMSSAWLMSVLFHGPMQKMWSKIKDPQ